MVSVFYIRFGFFELFELFGLLVLHDYSAVFDEIVIAVSFGLVGCIDGGSLAEVEGTLLHEIWGGGNICRDHHGEQNGVVLIGHRLLEFGQHCESELV